MASLFQVGLALILIVSATTGDDKCRTGCHGVTPNTFKFAEGTTYKYEYEGNIDLSLSSAEGQRSTTKVKATVLLTQQAECNQILRVQNLQIISGDSKKYTNIANIEKPIKLNFHDGHVEDVICTDPSDTQNSLNIKRALASMFQAALKHHGNEIDVFGSCPTEFTTRKEGPLQIIKKTRNLNKCSHRESIKQDFMTTAFDVKSEFKNNPFLQGEYETELKVKQGIPQLITVTEDYLYIPFSNGNKGAKANVVSQLKYAGVSKENPKVSCTIPKSILFDDPHPLTTDKNTVGTILNAIKDAAKSIDINVKDNSASKFSNIIKLMRGASKKDLMVIYGQVRAGAGFSNKEIGKRVFLDALFRTSTGEAVEVGIEIYKSHGLNEIESKIFFVGLNFIKHVTEDALSSAANLLSEENLPREAYLGIGVLAGRYCRQHSCENVKGLTVLLKAFQSKLVSRPADRQAENLVVTILKAVGNAGHVTNALAGKIIEIAQDKHAPSRLRVAALEAYLSDACNDRFRDSGINILKDIQQDSEIRIKAYLAISECPNGKVAAAVKKLLDDEPSIQVGGFIVSHLATIRSSVNPDKALARAQLGEIKTVKKFPVDFRQYSFNGENSYDAHSLGAATSLESNIIYSQKSLLARSATLNLTTEIFGHRYNFLELDARQENLDLLLSTFIGPKGLLKSVHPRKLFQDSSAKLKELLSHAGQRIVARPKREVNKNQIEAFAKQLVDKQNALNKDLDLDLSIKLFGSELLFLSLNEDIMKYTPETIMENILDCIDKTKVDARDFDKTLTSNLLFLDAVVSYPTSTGFPLRLSVEGASSIQLKASGKLDLNDLAELNGVFKLSLIPSVNVELVSRFVVDAALVESGLSVIGNLYSSVGAAIEATGTAGELDYKVSLPLDKQELISFTHNIVFETRELAGPEVQVPIKFTQSKDFAVCLDQLSPFIGLTFCAKLNQPNIAEESTNILPYPFNGNSKVAVVIEKNDFGYFHVHLKPSADAIEALYEVVDAHNKPKTSFKYELQTISPSIVLDFHSPVKSARFEGRLVQSSSELYGLLRLTSDQLEYYIKIGATYASSPTRAVYKPIMEYKAGQGAAQQIPYHITGQIILENPAEQTEGRFIFDDVKLVGPDRPPIGITGSIIKRQNELATDLTLNDGTHKGTVKGKIQVEKKLVNVNVQLVNDFNPSINFDVKYKLQVEDKNNIDSDLQLIHGPDISNKNALFKLSNSIQRKGEGDDATFKTEHELSYTGLAIDDKFKLEYGKKNLDVEAQFAYKKIKIGTDLEIELDKKTKGDLEFDWELYGFENKLEVELSRQVSGFKSKVHHKFTLNGNSLEVEGEVKHLIEQHRGDIGQNLVIKITSKPEIKWKTELKYTQNDIDTSIKVQSGQDVWIDAFLKANRGGDANGNLKLAIPGRVQANGQIKSIKGSGSTNLVVNFLEIQRKLKGEITFTVKDPTYNFDIIVYSDFEKDNSKKYRLATANVIKQGSLFDTKNTMEYHELITIVNIKLANSGDFSNSEQQAEYEIILPNEQYFAGKFDRKYKSDKAVHNAQAVLNLEQRPNKNAAGRTLSLKAIGKDINTSEGIIDLAYNLALDNGAGKTLNGELVLKRSKVNEERHIDYNGKLYGSIIPEPFDANILLKYTPTKADYKISTNYGKAATLNLKGKYDIHESDSKQPSTGELHLDILAPDARIRVVKFNVQGSVLEPHTDDDNLEIKGTTSLFVDDDGSQQGATLDLKSDTDIKLSATEGHIKETFRAQKLDPISVDVGYKCELEKKYQGDITVQYKKDKVVKGSLNVETPNNETAILDLQLESPEANAKTVRLQSKVTNTDDTFKSESTFTVNDLKYVSQVAIVLDEKQPWYNIELKYPNGKSDQLYSKLLKLDEDSIAGENKVVLHIYDFSLENNFDITVHDVEDFQIKFYIDCPKIQVDKLSVTANTKDVHGAKKLFFNAKESEKNIVNGVTTYKIKKEEGKIIIDGSGTVTVNNEKKTGNFKVLYRELNEERDKEEGIQLTINSVIGTKAFDIEYIYTEDHFKYLTSYCVEKKECAHVEVEAKTQDDDNLTILEVNVDLRPLGVSHEFGLKSETQARPLKHTLDVHLVSNQFKYQYSVLLLPTESHFTLTTPKRIVSLESQVNSPKGKEPYKGSVVLYLNKKQKPNDKTVLDFEISRIREYAGSYDLKLTTPALNKPLLIKYKSIERQDTEVGVEIVLDLLPTGDKKFVQKSLCTMNKDTDSVKMVCNSFVDFQPLNYKVTEEVNALSDTKNNIVSYDYKLTSLYQNRPAVFSYNGKLSPENAYAKLVLYNQVIFDINSKLKLSKEYSVIDTVYNIVGIEPRTSRLEFKGGNTLKFVLHKTATPNHKLQVNSGLIPGSIADFRVDVQTDQKKIDLVHGSIKLDEADFGKSDYAIDSNNIKEYFISPAKKLSESAVKGSTNAVSEALKTVKTNLKQMGETAKANRPDYTPVFVYYQTELKSLREELITDQSLKQLSESVSNIITAVVNVAVDLTKTITTVVEQTFTAIYTQGVKIWETLEKDLWPKLQKLISNLTDSLLVVIESVTNLVFGVLDHVSAFFDAHQKEVKQIVTTLSQVGKEIIRFIQKASAQIADILASEFGKIAEEIKAVPIAQNIENFVKQTLSGKEIPAESIEEFKTHVDQLKSKTDSKKLAHLIEITGAYLEKKMRKQPCDDKAEISAIVRAIIEAVDQIIEDLIDEDEELDITDLPIPSKILETLPNIVLSRCSFIRRIVNGDLPEWSQLTSLLNFNPSPFRKYAIIVQGQHIFTFDGKHLTFPGKCSYLLSRDIVDDRFSIVGTYANGALTELTFADREDTITVKKSGAVSLNGAATEFPVRAKNVHAFRKYRDVTLTSETGVRVICTPDLTMCVFSLSSFYHGHVRGLLGNANAEPFDDYTLPKGNIVTSESDFGNAYKLVASCPNVKTVDHHTHSHVESCTKLFTEFSDLSFCYPFVNPSNFRQACDHGVAAKIPNTEAAIAAGYVAACVTKYVPVLMPSQYVSCENSDKTYNLYDTFSVKLPQKAADIVFAIDADTKNAEIYKDLVVALGSSLVKELSDRGIKDVEYHVLTYGGDYTEWPSHITTNGGKMTFKGKMPALKFSEAPDEDDVDVGIEPVNFFISLIQNYIQELNLALGNEPQSQAYVEAIQYPFRTHALKTIIAVSSEPCKKGQFQWLQKLRARLLRQPVITLNLITPLGKDCDFKVKDEKTTKTVIGFNNEAVFTYTDVKKRPGGNPDLVKDLEYNDFCSEEVVLDGGNVFALDNFNKGKKIYTSTVAYNIAESLVSNEQGLDCVCLRNGLLTAENKCRVIYQKKKETPSKKLLKG